VKSNFNLEHLLGNKVEVVDKIIADIDKHVKRIEIPKRDGTKRKILAPDSRLKYIQKRINWLIFMKFKPNPNAHGFIKKRGIATNAARHVGVNSIGHIDVKNFFDSISTNHMKNCLFGNKNICRYCKNYNKMLEGYCHPSIYKNKEQRFPHKCEELKAVYIPKYCEETGYESLFLRLISLCTYNGFAAQGFPTSPYLANIVIKGFDNKIAKLAVENNCNYTRYADDMTFSSNTLDKNQLRALFKQKCYRLLWAFGFAPNKKKTHWKDVGRFKVCGVVVNEKLNIMRKTVRVFRAKVHNATVKNEARTTKTYIRKLKGWASYLMSVNREKGEKYMRLLTVFENRKWPKVA